MKVVEIKEKEFDEKIKGKKVLVDCYAPWCGPCRMLSPVIDEVSEEIEDVEFYKINMDDANEVGVKYGIMSIPTILYFENGELREQVVGFKTKDELKELLDK